METTTMNTTGTKPTAGAMRAANCLCALTCTMPTGTNLREFAAIIDRETGAAELLTVVKALLQMPTEQTAIAERAREWVREQARAAIAKAEGSK